MTFKFIFNFCNVDNLPSQVLTFDNSILVNNIVNLPCPAMPKPDSDTIEIKGWRINTIKGDLSLVSNQDVLLTKDNILQFDGSNLEDTTYTTAINCYVVINSSSEISLGMEWDSFDYKVMTVVVDQAEPDPYAACSYADDAIGMEPGSDLWDTWFGYYPVVLDNGVEYKRIDPNDFTKYVDGTDIGTLADTQDKMIARPIMGWKATLSGSKIYISMTNRPCAEGFVYHAHFNGERYVQNFYEGIEQIASSQTLTDFLNKAFLDKKGDRYTIRGYYQRLFWQIQYLLKYKNTNSNLLLTEDELIYGYPQTTTCLGLEKPWGSREWLGGLFCNESGNVGICKNPTKFSDIINDPNYTIFTIQSTAEGGGLIGTMRGTDDLCFIPTDGFKDYLVDLGVYATPFSICWGSINSNSFAAAGGGGGGGGFSGIFSLAISMPADVRLPSRLMYV